MTSRPGVFSAALAALSLLSACSHGAGDPDADGDAVDASASDAGPIYVPSECPTNNMLPERGTQGAVQCVPVGATIACNDAQWPDLAARPTPHVYVDPGVDPALADGTTSHPFADLRSALAFVATGGTVALTAGEFPLSGGPAIIGSAVTVVGSGAGCTTVVGDRGGAIFAANASGSALGLDGLALRYAGAGQPVAADHAIDAQGTATITLRDVWIQDPAVGVAIAGGSLDALRLSVDRALEDGVLLTAGAAGDLRECAIRDGAGLDVHAGVRALDAYLLLADSLVFHNAGYGVSVRGAPSGARGAADCVARTGPGENSCVSNVAITCDGYAALTARGTVHLDVRRSVLSGARAVGGEFGDGLDVEAGASVRLDLDVDTATPGAGSEVVGNVRNGILATGSGAEILVRGALLGSNGAAGLFVQAGARATEVSGTLTDDNGALGIGIAYDGAVGSILRNRITRTRDVPITVTGAQLVLGDGLSVTPVGTADVRDNEISFNRRFGAIFVHTGGTLLRNAGRGNRFGLGVYDAPGLTVDDAGALTGSEQAPATAPPTP